MTGRGGNNFFQVRVSSRPVHSPRDKADIIIALDKDAVEADRGALTPGGVLLLDAAAFGVEEGDEDVLDVPLYAIAKECGGPIYANAAALGALAALVCADFEDVIRAINREFGSKGGEISANNVKASRKGFDFVSSGGRSCGFPLASAAHRRDCLIADNEALELGCGFVARGYSAEKDHLAELILAGIAHKGFSLIDVVQPCVSFNKLNTYDWFSKRIYKMGADHDAANKAAAVRLTEERERLPIGG